MRWGSGGGQVGQWVGRRGCGGDVKGAVWCVANSKKSKRDKHFADVSRVVRVFDAKPFVVEEHITACGPSWRGGGIVLGAVASFF